MKLVSCVREQKLSIKVYHKLPRESVPRGCACNLHDGNDASQVAARSVEVEGSYIHTVTVAVHTTTYMPCIPGFQLVQTSNFTWCHSHGHTRVRLRPDVCQSGHRTCHGCCDTETAVMSQVIFSCLYLGQILYWSLVVAAMAAINANPSTKLIWIASAPDTAFKPRHVFMEGAVLKQKKANMNQKAEADAVRNVCGECHIDLVAEPPGQVLAVALVKPKCMHDELQLLQRHEQLQYNLYQLLHGGSLVGRMVFFEISEVFELPQKMPIQAISARRTRSFFFNLEDGQAERLTDVLQACDTAGLLPGWLQQRLGNAVNAFVCVRLPKAFALLCSKGHWSTFAAADLFHAASLVKGWSIAASPQVWDPASFPQTRFAHPQEPANIVKPDVAEEFAHALTLAAAKLQSVCAEHGAEAHAALVRMHDIVCSLRQHVHETRSAFRVGDAVRSGCEAYDVFYLINCFLFCNVLKADQDLRKAIELACKVVLPKHMCDSILELFRTEDRPIPHMSTISRFRLKLDVAAMLLTRDWLHKLLQQRGGIISHIMVDASPQGGHDYELLSVCIAAKHDLPAIHVDILRLEQARSMPLCDREEWLSEEQEIMSRLRSKIHQLTPPPTLLGMGKGRATLAFKFQTAIHSLHLVAGPGKNLQQFIQSIQTWLSDLGTEAGFSQVRKMPLRSLLPYLEIDGRAQDGFCMEEVDFAPPMNPDAGPEEVFVDTEGSLTIPGFLHILHNCFAGLADCLPRFSETVDQLQQVAKLLARPESKQRLLRSCFHDHLGQALCSEIQEFKVLVYDKRWGTVAHSVLALLRCEAGLRRKWNLEQYLAGAVLSEEHDLAAATESQDSVSLQVVDSAIHSSSWWQYLRMIKQFAALQSTLIAWAESCPCHWDLHHQEAVPSKLKQLWDTCPLRGRRCAELASGEFWTYVHRPCPGVCVGSAFLRSVLASCSFVASSQIDQ